MNRYTLKIMITYRTHTQAHTHTQTHTHTNTHTHVSRVMINALLFRLCILVLLMSCGIALYWLKKRYLVRQLFTDDRDERRRARRRRTRRYRQLSGNILIHLQNQSRMTPNDQSFDLKFYFEIGFYAPEGTSGGILKSHRLSVCLSELTNWYLGG